MALSIEKLAELTKNRNYQFNVYYNPQHFNEALNSLKKITIPQVTRLKFEYTITDHLAPKKKGIYIFTLEDFGFPSIDFRYLLYIGRTIKTNSFKSRFYKYRNTIDDPSAVENVVLFTNLWPNNTYVYFFEIAKDSEIEELEKIMVNKLLPMFNQQYYSDTSIKTTSLYKLGNP